LAASLLAENGFKVVCLEQGDWMNPRDYPGVRPDWELLEQKSWSPNPNIRARPVDYPCETSDSDFDPLMFAAVGGSTIMFRAHWVRLLPSDFRVRSLDGVADDWPFTYEDLVPYYDAIDELVGTAGLAGDPAYPPGTPPPLPPHPIGLAGRKVAQGLNQLSWHWWPAPNAIASRRYRGLNPCARYGTCSTGCPNGSKASFDLVVWPQAIRAGVRLVTHARVRNITVNNKGLATGAIYVDSDGIERQQTADVVIVAANAIGTPRILLLSKSAQFPDGLANSSGLVGKRLMTHPNTRVVGIFDEEFPSWQGPFGQLIQSMQFYETDVSRGFVRGAKWGLLPSQSPINLGISALLDNRGLEAKQPHEAVRDHIGHSVQWGILLEDLPSSSNRVVLDDNVTDSDGIPAPKIVSHLSENLKRNMEFQIARAKEALEAAGARRVYDTGLSPTRSHSMGTTVMGQDPRTSVVDQYGRSHDVQNLYIFGASTFPTGGAANPTATLCAITLRAVDNLIAHRRLQRVPT
jgi:choline dehydrogenase-like flavoprotein